MFSSLGNTSKICCINFILACWQKLEAHVDDWIAVPRLIQHLFNWKLQNCISFGRPPSFSFKEKISVDFSLGRHIRFFPTYKRKRGGGLFTQRITLSQGINVYLMFNEQMLNKQNYQLRQWKFSTTKNTRTTFSRSKMFPQYEDHQLSPEDCWLSQFAPT